MPGRLASSAWRQWRRRPAGLPALLPQSSRELVQQAAPERWLRSRALLPPQKGVRLAQEPRTHWAGCLQRVRCFGWIGCRFVLPIRTAPQGALSRRLAVEEPRRPHNDSKTYLTHWSFAHQPRRSIHMLLLGRACAPGQVAPVRAQNASADSASMIPPSVQVSPSLNW